MFSDIIIKWKKNGTDKYNKMIKNNRSLRRKVTNKNILHVVKYFNVTFPFKWSIVFLVFIDNGYVTFFTFDNKVETLTCF